MSRSSREQYWQRIYPRYRRASRTEKRRILDEFCANCSYHRKHAIRLLNGSPPEAKPPRRRRRRDATYSSRVISILQAVWEAADYPWSVRLKALLPEWMPQIRQRFHLTPELEQQLLQISPRSIDYRLRSEKRKLRRRIYGRTKPGTLLKHHIPLKTDHWDVKIPGFTEIDLVSHSGNSATGEFCYSLNVTDIHTGWTETRAVLGKSQEAVRAALEAVREALPFALRGIDSDNGSEFINQHLFRYCDARAIQFTRGRPYKKDDNAHIEQKNWTHVRRLLGYVRYDTEAAREAINRLYRDELRLFQNLFMPSVKLARKERVGSRLRRHYEAPATPFQRVAASPVADPERVAELRQQRETLDPFQLSATIRAKLEQIFQLSTTVKENGDLSGAAPQGERVIERKAHRRARAKAKTARGEKAKTKTKPSRKGKENRRRRVTLQTAR
ncbi:MAG: DDE-type integrase/transposase/recombinase [Bryobacteraceae bacterium]